MADVFTEEWFKAEANNAYYQSALDDAKNQRGHFLEKYSYEKLRTLSDEEILSVMFQNDKKTENMCSALLGNETNRFVDVGQGSMHQFLLYYDYGKNKNKKNNPGVSGWTIGSASKEKKISPEVALSKAKEIRDGIVKIADYIEANGESNPASIDYEELGRFFSDAGFNKNQRFLKYFAISFPYIIPLFFTEKWRTRLFSLLAIKPEDDNIFLQLGQIARIIKDIGIDPILFARIVFHNSDRDLAKPERQSTMDNQRKNDISLNTILYGPPGTGKTYETINYAVAIMLEKDLEFVRKAREEGTQIEGKTVEGWYQEGIANEQIAFVTFHQSYGYEEFIEGIRPDLEGETSELKYKIKGGIFKDFCNKNLEETSSIDTFESSWQKLESAAYEYGKEYTFCRKTGSKFTGVLVEDAFRVIWKTGTFNTLSKLAIRDQWEGKIKRDNLSGGNLWAYDARQAIINEMMKQYNLPEYSAGNELKGKCGNKVFIIDEINRGNISKIFGELITLIEDTKRGEMSAVLPYSKERFTVPKNVYILGTMNTADRSIATLDTALRRRFHFKEMQPNPGSLDGVVIDGLEIRTMLESMNKKISILYDREHTIGHSYFMPLKEDPNIKNLAIIFANNIIPLLQEYFYDDYEKIRLVLGDNKKDEKRLQFIIAQPEDVVELFGDNNIDIDESMIYEINSEAFEQVDSYRSI